MLKKALLLLVACAVCLAVWKTIPHDNAGSVIDWAKDKTSQIHQWSDGASSKITGKTENLPPPNSLIPKTGPTPAPTTR